jgi:GNAT superfamily N-acetyltransferase
MREPIQAVPLEDMDERLFLNYLNKDRIRHIFTLCDLKNMREKTRVWVALRNTEVTGYIFEYDRRIVHTHGDPKNLLELLSKIDLDEPVLVIQPNHLKVVKKVFEPFEHLDPLSKGKITTFLVMKANSATFTPTIKHEVKKLRTEDLIEASKSLGEELKNLVQNAINRGFAYGGYENGLLVSCATVSEHLEDVALIRGVFTVPSMRGQGLSTSVCSVLVEELIRLGKTPMLWVSKDNLPALKLYVKLGFIQIGIVLKCFKAKRKGRL